VSPTEIAILKTYARIDELTRALKDRPAEAAAIVREALDLMGAARHWPEGRRRANKLWLEARRVAEAPKTQHAPKSANAPRADSAPAPSGAKRVQRWG
jgi:hypothetical protein